MTLFDYIAGALLLISGLMGYARGATREVTTVIAFVLAAIVTVFGLRFTGPIARHAIHTAWIANTVAILALFIVVYVILRLIGGALTRSVRGTVGLSSLDRILGFAIGLVRALVIMGAFSLLMGAATPPERMPGWITKAKLYPLASAAGDALRTFAPQGLKVAHTLEPAMEDAVTNAAAPTADTTTRAPTRHRGYTDAQRKALDELVEKSR